MLNQVVIAGRLTGDPVVEEVEGGKKVSSITVAVPRSYKNVDGTYDTDFIKCTLWGGIAENTAEYCKKGDIVGVKGRVQSRMIEDEDGNNYKKMEVIAEKITFLSSKKEED
ncbi:MAG: single-stranded DNA-binding protein [Clostridium sp.]|nr:single-stranded DNA-binding protein [Clostridium sp.]